MHSIEPNQLNKCVDEKLEIFIDDIFVVMQSSRVEHWKKVWEVLKLSGEAKFLLKTEKSKVADEEVH